MCIPQVEIENATKEEAEMVLAMYRVAQAAKEQVIHDVLAALEHRPSALELVAEVAKTHGLDLTKG